MFFCLLEIFRTLICIFAFRKPNKMFFLYYLRDSLQLILAPAKGWEDVSADGLDDTALLKKGLIPFLVLTALSSFVGMFSDVDVLFISILQQSIITFIKYFATYYLACLVFTLYLPSCISGEFSLKKCHTYITYGITLLAVVNIIENCIPVELAVVYIMPIYVLYILWRGLRYMSVSFDGVGTFLLITILSILLPPYALQYLFNFVLSL